MLRLALPLLRRLGLAVLSAAALLGLPGCGYNEFQTLDEQVTAAWAQVESQYQRRSDLIPNIVATVKGEANFEKSTLESVVSARAKATQMTIDPDKLDEASIAKYKAAQGELSGALSRLLMVTENYPNL